MNIIHISAFLLLLGNLLIIAGFGAFPSRIYTGRDIQEKSNLLTAMPQRWIFSQMLVILGGFVFIASSIFLVLLFRESQGFLLAGMGAVGFVLGHIFWIWILGLRTVEPQKWVNDELPGWLYKTYSILFLLGLAGYGAAFWLQGDNQVLGISIFLGALLILSLFLKLKEMPPIVYYSLTLVIGLTLLF